jgi:uncharacterized protein (DUF302 family)
MNCTLKRLGDNMAPECIYGFGIEISIGFEELNSKIEKLLHGHGFEVYTRLYLQDIVGDFKFENMGRYVILGACNAEFAKELFAADPDIGLLMPCNIVIYEKHEGVCRVMIKDPVRIMDLIRSPFAIETAMKVKEQLELIIDELK